LFFSFFRFCFVFGYFVCLFVFPSFSDFYLTWYVFSGIIATNKWDAEETAQTVIADWKEAQAKKAVQAAQGFAHIGSILAAKGLRAVSFAEWKQIEEEERKRGKEKGKTSEKITILSDMLKIIAPNQNE
jgi:hypothetical protein